MLDMKLGFLQSRLKCENTFSSALVAVFPVTVSPKLSSFKMLNSVPGRAEMSKQAGSGKFFRET